MSPINSSNFLRENREVPIRYKKHQERRDKRLEFGKFCHSRDLHLISSVGVGRKGNAAPPPKSGKTVVENGSYLPGVYTFGEEAEIQ